MVLIGAADDELHRCLLSQETESAADCVLTTSTEDQPGRCELLGAAGTRTARARSAICGIAELTFWRDVLKLALASKRDLIERAMQDELIRRKPGLADGLRTSEHDREAEDASAPSLDWWHPKPRPHCAPEAAPATGEGLDVQAGGTRQRCVGPVSSATAAPAPAPAPATKAPWHSECVVHVKTKASRKEQSQSSPPSPPQAVSSSGYDTVSGAQENEPILEPSATAICHLAGGLLAMAFGFAAVGLLLAVRRGVRCGRRRRSERERRRASSSGGLLSSGRASPESSSSRPCDNISQ